MGYPGRPTDFQHFYWDKLVTASTQLIMPLNRSVFHGLVVQAVGAGMTLFLLVGLVLWGRKRWPLLALALAWLCIFLAPALNLIDAQPENFNNRLLYFSLMGFCIGLAVLLSSLVSEPIVRRLQMASACIYIPGRTPLLLVAATAMGGDISADATHSAGDRGVDRTHAGAEGGIQYDRPATEP